MAMAHGSWADADGPVMAEMCDGSRTVAGGIAYWCMVDIIASIGIRLFN